MPTHFRELYPDIVTLPQHFNNNGHFTRGTGTVVAEEVYDHDSSADESRNVVASTPDGGAWQVAVQLLERQFPRRGYD